jgi:hypothetical protein
MNCPRRTWEQLWGKGLLTDSGCRFHVIVFAAALIIIVLRRPDALLNPQFWAEDGTVFYAEAYHKGIIIPLLSQYGGYLDTFPRLVADLSQFFPLTWAPLIFNISAIIIKALPVVLLMSSRFSALLPDWRTRAFLSLLYLALPNSWEVNTGALHGKIYLALLAFMVLSSPAAVGLMAFITDISITLLSGLSGPFCFILAPVSALFWFFRRDRRSFALFALLCICALIQATAFFSSASVRPPRSLGASPYLFFKILSEQVFLGALIGQAGIQKLMAFPGLFRAAVIISATGGLAACIYALLKASLQLRLLILYGFLLFCAALSSPLVSLAGSQWPLLLLPGVGGRYWFIPMLAFICVLVWSLRKASSRLSKLLATAAFAIMIMGIILDWRYPPLRDLDFKEHAHRFESAPAGTLVTIPINPSGWSITLIKH